MFPAVPFVLSFLFLSITCTAADVVSPSRRRIAEHDLADWSDGFRRTGSGGSPEGGNGFERSRARRQEAAASQMIEVTETTVEIPSSFGTMEQKCLTLVSDPTQSFCTTFLNGQNIGSDSGLGTAGAMQSAAAASVVASASGGEVSISTSSVRNASTSTTAAGSTASVSASSESSSTSFSGTSTDAEPSASTSTPSTIGSASASNPTASDAAPSIPASSNSSAITSASADPAASSSAASVSTEASTEAVGASSAATPVQIATSASGPASAVASTSISVDIVVNAPSAQANAPSASASTSTSPTASTVSPSGSEVASSAASFAATSGPAEQGEPLPTSPTPTEAPTSSELAVPSESIIVVNDPSVPPVSSPSATAAAAEADSGVTPIPGQKMQVLPIGLGIFGGLVAITLAIVGYVLYERRKYKLQFQRRKDEEKASFAARGAGMGYT